MDELFVTAFFIGLFLKAVPGAVFAESLRRGLRGGFRPAFAVQIGSLAGNLVWAVLGLAGGAALLSLPMMQAPLALAGAALLGWLAVQALRDGLAAMPFRDVAGGSARPGPALLSGAMLSLSNPMNIAYWAGLGGTGLAAEATGPGWIAASVFLGGFLTASVLWSLVCAGLIARSRRHLGPLAWKALHFGSAAGLAWVAWCMALPAMVPLS